jgi:hypothetical protein
MVIGYQSSIHHAYPPIIYLKKEKEKEKEKKEKSNLKSYSNSTKLLLKINNFVFLHLIHVWNIFTYTHKQDTIAKVLPITQPICSHRTLKQNQTKPNN